jgi:hypothetical protein
MDADGVDTAKTNKPERDQDCQYRHYKNDEVFSA